MTIFPHHNQPTFQNNMTLKIKYTKWNATLSLDFNGINEILNLENCLKNLQPILNLSRKLNSEYIYMNEQLVATTSLCILFMFTFSKKKHWVKSEK